MALRLILNNSLHIRSLYYMQLRFSMWPKEFKEPIVDKNKLQELSQTGEINELMFQPIKAALSTDNLSIFSDPLLDKFINICMMKGKKALMRAMMIETFGNIKRIQIEKYHNAKTDEERAKIELDPLIIFHKAIHNCRPLLITKPIKRDGATYQVPFPLTETSSISLCMRWIRDTIRDRPKPRTVYFPQVLANELIDAYYNEGKVIRKKQDVHKLCEANKAYAHYRWG